MDTKPYLFSILICCITTASFSSIPLQKFGFDNQLTSQQTGWQFLGKGYRAYNPTLHRFMAQDSKSPFAKGGINGYIFSNNNPIMKYDPSGHNALPALANLALLIEGTALGNYFSWPILGNLIGSLAGQAAQNGIEQATGNRVEWIPEMAGALASPVAMGTIVKSTEYIGMKLFQSRTQLWLGSRMLAGVAIVDGGALAGEATKDWLAKRKFQPSIPLLAAGAATGLISGVVDYSMTNRYNQFRTTGSAIQQDPGAVELEYTQSLKPDQLAKYNTLKATGRDFILEESDVLKTNPLGWQDQWRNSTYLKPFYFTYKYGIHRTLEYVGDDIFAVFERDQAQTNS